MDTSKAIPLNLQSKKHFEILDGLRGVAALAVVIFHFMEWAYTDFSKNFIAHGFLAVDFFFCLSGFVIGYAYDDRIGKMGMLEFFKSRAIRLHPLVVAGSVLGLLAFLFDPFGGQPELYSTGKIILAFVCSVLLIPLPEIADRGFNLFSFNAPSWSLFWEYVANIVYAFVLYKIRRNYLALLTIISAIAICFVCYRAGNLLGGWSGPTFWDGAARISYSFLAGLLIYRFNWIIKNKLGFIGLAILLSMAFMMPFTKWNWLSESLVVLFYFPLLVALGAGAALAPGLRKLCTFSGKISYPLYMTHYAVLWMFGNYYTKYQPDTLQLTFIIIAMTILLIGLAYLVMVFYDVPIRNYLSSKRNKRNRKKMEAYPFPSLQTKRLILRQIIPTDIQDIYKGLSNPKVIKYYGVSFDSLAGTAEQMTWYSNLEQNETGIWWAICSVDHQTFYGVGGFNNLSNVHKKAEIGFWLLPEFWRQGLMQESEIKEGKYLSVDIYSKLKSD